MTSRPSLSDAEIVDRCKSGALVRDLDRWDLDETNPGSTVARCVALHNASQIDFLGLVHTAEFAALSGPEFFAVQHAFTEAIPQLDPPPRQVMAAVKILVEKGGNDGTKPSKCSASVMVCERLGASQRNY
jgi:hypothetical protein